MQRVNPATLLAEESAVGKAQVVVALTHNRFDNDKKLTEASRDILGACKALGLKGSWSFRRSF